MLATLETGKVLRTPEQLREKRGEEKGARLTSCVVTGAIMSLGKKCSRGLAKRGHLCLGEWDGGITKGGGTGQEQNLWRGPRNRKRYQKGQRKGPRKQGGPGKGGSYRGDLMGGKNNKNLSEKQKRGVLIWPPAMWTPSGDGN